MKAIIVGFLLFVAQTVFADGIDPTRPFLLTDARGIGIQGASIDPATTIAITDNYQHTVSLFPSVLWVGMYFNGTASCIVRFMSSTTRGNFPAIPVTNGTTISSVVHKNATYFNYSGCAGGTYPATSVLFKMGQ